jgi:hypothetical protein
MRIISSLALYFLLWIASLQAGVITGTDETASLPSWEWRIDDITFTWYSDHFRDQS